MYVVLLVVLDDGALGAEAQAVQNVARDGAEGLGFSLEGKCFCELIQRLVRHREHLFLNRQYSVVEGDVLLLAQHLLKRVAMDDAGEPGLGNTKLPGDGS